MTARLYVPDACAPGEVVALPADEAAHLTRVLRAGVGDAVRVFNGRGGEFAGVVVERERRGVRVRLDAVAHAAREARVTITFAPAVLKGDRMDAVIRDAVMMGVAAIQPVLSARVEMTAAALERGRRRDRWERIAVASAKQCGRAVVPAILPPLLFEQLIATLATDRAASAAIMFVEPAAHSGAETLDAVAGPAPAAATVLVGPEGGWTPEETLHGAAACRRISLQSPTLRADAMPIVALTALLAVWGEI